MGYFSWKTADTQQSIANRHSRRFSNKPVYLLQPNGEPPLEEPAYDGYGVFGGVDAYVWLAEHNLPAEIVDGMDEEERRSAGIALGLDDTLWKDSKTGQIYTIFHPVSFLGAMGVAVKHLGVTWDEKLPELDGMNANEARAKGRLVQASIRGLIGMKFPLKFSLRKGACYEELGESQECPAQGYFYDHGEED